MDRRNCNPSLREDNAWYRETLTELLDSLAAGKIKPMVAERFPLAEAAPAHELVERARHAGKVVLVTSAWSGLAFEAMVDRAVERYLRRARGQYRAA